MQKLLVICGPTVTGKTKLALHLAKVFNGEIISADSRQVYKYMDIGTGKDKPEGIEINGYDLVNPDEEFSVSQYADFANACIREINSRGKLPILVGGTGLYIKGVVDGIDTADIPKDEKLRVKLNGLKIEDLQEKLKKIDSKKFASMNDSDINNPRRLIRAIEVASSGKISERKGMSYDVLFIGLSLSREKLDERITKRVDDRINQGFDKEIDFLKKKDFFRYAPARTLGYKDWPDIKKWKREEIKYAKRQMTWFKKDKRIKWFDIETNDYKQKVEDIVQKWYSLS